MYEFVKSNHPAILKWTGKDANAEAFFTKASSGSSASPSEVKLETIPARGDNIKKEEVKKPAAAPGKKVKEPVKIKKWNTWEISDWKNDTLKFSGDDVAPGVTFNFFNCEKLKVEIEGKCKNLMIQRGKKIDITIDEAISMMEVIKSEGIKIKVQKRLPCISIELCNEVKVITTNESKRNVSLNITAS